MSDTSGRKLFQHSGTALLFRGVLAIFLGWLIASLPVATVFALVYVFGVYAMADGLTNLAHYFYDPARHSRWSLTGGLISVAVGLIAVSWPGITATALSVLVGAWALVLGVTEIILALDARKTLHTWWAWLLTALVTTLFGILVLANPAAGVLSLVGMLAAFSVVSGLFLIASGVKLRRMGTARLMRAA